MDTIEVANWTAKKAIMGKRPRPFGFGPHETLIIQIVIIGLALVILWWMLRSHYKKSSFNKSDTPLDILKKRYAAGEITKKEFAELKKDISR